MYIVRQLVFLTLVLALVLGLEPGAHIAPAIGRFVDGTYAEGDSATKSMINSGRWVAARGLSTVGWGIERVQVGLRELTEAVAPPEEDKVIQLE